MSATRVRLAAAVVLGVVPLAALAANPTLDDLLARARQEEAAGHQFAPPGDNVVETISQMMDLVPTATPGQLAEIMGLLDRTKKASPPTSLAKVEPAELPPARDKGQPPAPSAQAERVSPPPAAASTPATPQPPAGASPAAGAPPLAGASPPAAAPPTPPLTGPPLTGPPQASGADAAMKQHVTELLARGHAAENRGDVSGARRFYMSAAELNSPEAALNLGRLYDPAYLSRNAIGGLDPDPALARKWYGRAVALGDAEAGPLLAALSSR